MAGERGFIPSQEWLITSLKLLAHSHGLLSAPLQSVTLLSAITEQGLATSRTFLLLLKCEFSLSHLILWWWLSPAFLFIVHLPQLTKLTFWLKMLSVSENPNQNQTKWIFSIPVDSFANRCSLIEFLMQMFFPPCFTTFHRTYLKFVPLNSQRWNLEVNTSPFGVRRKRWGENKCNSEKNGSFQLRGRIFSLSILHQRLGRMQRRLSRELQFYCGNGHSDLWCSNVMVAVPRLLVEVVGGRVAGTSVQTNQGVQDRDDRRMAFSFPCFTAPSLPRALNCPVITHSTLPDWF